jgi:DNA-3-methyladenine glycosylase II
LTDKTGASEPALIVPPYWADACKHLVKKDRVMKRLIPQFGSTCLQSRGDAFSTLARSIVGQQISVKAAQTVWHRFAALPAEMTPAHVLRLKVDDMRAAGLSPRKVEYLVDLSIHFDAGRVHVQDWQAMEDETIIAELIAIRGIGRWTAEMFLMFYLTRPNVLPLDDVGLINGISHNYFSGESVSRRLGALLQRGDLVYLALPGPESGAGCLMDSVRQHYIGPFKI